MLQAFLGRKEVYRSCIRWSTNQGHWSNEWLLKPITDFKPTVFHWPSESYKLAIGHAHTCVFSENGDSLVTNIDTHRVKGKCHFGSEAKLIWYDQLYTLQLWVTVKSVFTFPPAELFWPFGYLLYLCILYATCINHKSAPKRGYHTQCILKSSASKTIRLLCIYNLRFRLNIVDNYLPISDISCYNTIDIRFETYLLWASTRVLLKIFPIQNVVNWNNEIYEGHLMSFILS